MSMKKHHEKQTLTIANGATTSDACIARDHSEFGVIMPAALTGVAITFTVSDSYAGTYVPLYTVANALVSVTVAASRAYDLPAELEQWPYFKIVSGATELAARSLIVVKKA